MDIIGALYGVGILQGVVLTLVLLFTPSGHRLANTFMAGLVAIITLSLVHSWLIRLGVYLDYPQAWAWLSVLKFAWGPMLYLYGYTLIHHRFHRKQLLHFLPMALLLVFHLGAYHTYTIDQQRLFLQFFWSPRTDPVLLAAVTEFLPKHWFLWIDWHMQGAMFVFQLATYGVLLLQQIREYNGRLRHHFSSFEHISLRWLRVLTFICLGFVALYLVFNRSQVILTGYFDTEAITPSLPFLFLVLVIYAIGIAALFQSTLVRGAEMTLPAVDNRQPLQEKADNRLAEETTVAVDAIEEPDADENPKYVRSGLSEDVAEDYKQRLLQAMDEHRWYLDCDLTLPELAEHTGLTRHQVSQVINERLNKNFFSFISGYRIERAKALITAPNTRDMPIVELALEVGFKSKSSFYKAFKKETGMTPTEFKKGLASSDDALGNPEVA